MKQAIISGSTGLIGSALVRRLVAHGVDVLALGRKPWSEVDPKRLTADGRLTYVQLDMSRIDTLGELVRQAGWACGGSCAFFNFAWYGASRLSDMEVDAQMRNVAWSAAALQAAGQIGCRRFVHVGTMEEAFTERYLELDFRTNTEFNRHVIYALAKRSSRDVLKLLAGKAGIDLMFATNSHAMGPNDDKDSFLQVTLGKLISGAELLFSTGEQMFDVLSAKDCALAYHLIGTHGKAGRSYRVGSGAARPLKEYVQIMADLYPSGQVLQFGKMPYNDISLDPSDFSIDSLVEDTGFRPTQTYEDAVRDLYQWLVNGTYQ
ncbi:MAG: NAD-dependent epimerase/dehydratase family protein [Planctomycetota bacterium]